ncbi:MAG TPA: complex I NDUFA9 subunit family protein [Quisquiliibacterium sp.]|nr:complex I NDUFA9 subunit family protein [Quisquiliibacterium sp.]
MKPSRILIVGGSGFIGRHLAARLSAQNRRIVVPSRRAERARHLLTLPTARLVDMAAADSPSMEALVAESDAVVNLVGILHGSWGEPYGREFAEAHVALPQRIAAACAKSGVRRLVHVSALGVSDDPAVPGPSMYLRSKADGERAIRATAGVDWTILRPSVIFGPEDQFLNAFADLQRMFPVIPLARAEARFQPVYVGDVAQAIVNALDTPETIGRTYELAGPEVFTLAELVRLAGRYSGHPRPVVPLSYTLGQLQAGLLGAMPQPMMSMDNFDSMSVDNVASGPIAPELKIVATPLASVAPNYLPRKVRYNEERAHARR